MKDWGAGLYQANAVPSLANGTYPVLAQVGVNSHSGVSLTVQG
jgi:hypothetical protein